MDISVFPLLLHGDFLTIFLTEVIHKPIERWVLHVPTMIGIPCLSVVTVVFIIDTAESVRTALDLAKVLDAMTKMKAELDDVQVQLALLKTETEQKLEEAKEDTAMKLENSPCRSSRKMLHCCEMRLPSVQPS